MTEQIPQFGNIVDGARYILRPGGYAIIINNEHQIATVNTPLGCFLPGGGCEPGESLVDAAVRETCEECGLHVHIVGEIGTADELVYAKEEQQYFRKRSTFFAAAIESSRIPIGEADHVLKWISRDAAQIELTHASQRWAISHEQQGKART